MLPSSAGDQSILISTKTQALTETKILGEKPAHAETNASKTQVTFSDNMATLYANFFGAEASKTLTTPNSSSCSLSSKMLTFATPKTGWLTPFILLLAVAFNLPPHISRLSRDNHRSSRPTKLRLHLKHCIFRE